MCMYLGLCNVRFVYFTTEELPRQGPKLASYPGPTPPRAGQGRAWVRGYSEVCWQKLGLHMVVVRQGSAWVQVGIGLFR